MAETIGFRDCIWSERGCKLRSEGIQLQLEWLKAMTDALSLGRAVLANRTYSNSLEGRIV